MKLELKHISPYLPYGLKGMLLSEDKTPIEQCELLGLYSDTVYLSKHYQDQDIEYFKPILRSLSDLTKEIEHNGKRFVPMDRLYPYQIDSYLVQAIENGSVEWAIIQKLHEWHFDTEGLTEIGLAIDINTLES